MAILNSYVKLPEGIICSTIELVIVQICREICMGTISCTTDLLSPIVDRYLKSFVWIKYYYWIYRKYDMIGISNYILWLEYHLWDSMGGKSQIFIKWNHVYPQQP